MSRRYFASEQQSNQAAAANSPVAETKQSMAESEDKSPRVRALHVLILGGLSALGPLSTDMYLPSLPTISRDLGATMSQTQLTLSAGILGLALGQVLTGPSSDALGRRRPLLIGMVAFALASLLCLVAPSIAALTALRFVQGVAGAAGIVISLAVARDLYAGIALARCISLLMGVTFLAPMVAPVIGSQLLTFSSWRGVFVTLALIGGGLLLATVFGLGETLPPSRRQSGGIAATLTAFRELLTDRRFLGYALSSSFAFAAGICYISSSPFILQNVYGVSPQFVGIVFGINAFGLLIMSQINARLVGRVSSQTLLTWGIAAVTIAGMSLLVVVLSGIGLVGVLASFFILVASLGLIAPNATALALANINTAIAGSASALLGVLQFSIGAVAAPLTGLGGTTTGLPMAAAIGAFGTAALATFIVLCRPSTISKEPCGNGPRN